MQANGNIPRTNDILIGPSLASGDWEPQMVWDTGFIDNYRDNLCVLTVEQYVDRSFLL